MVQIILLIPTSNSIYVFLNVYLHVHLVTDLLFNPLNLIMMYFVNIIFYTFQFSESLLPSSNQIFKLLGRTQSKLKQEIWPDFSALGFENFYFVNWYWIVLQASINIIFQSK